MISNKLNRSKLNLLFIQKTKKYIPNKYSISLRNFLCTNEINKIVIQPSLIGMRTLKFKTNIQEMSCVDRIASYLDNVKEIITWSVDTNTEDHLLVVQGYERLQPNDVVDIINLAGFYAKPIKNNLLKRLLLI